MYHDPETLLWLAHETQRTRYAEADRGRLLAAARRHRRDRHHRRTLARGTAPASTLAECAPAAAPTSG